MPKPKTAYELCERVCEHILEEPRRYFQNDWCRRGTGIQRMWSRLRSVLSIDQDGNEDVMKPVPPPVCNTVACRAGWIVLLHDGMKAKPRDFSDRANEILGVEWMDTQELFDGQDYGQPGTKAYARKGVAGLRAFMKEHKAQLKARSLKGV